ncbi:MAG: GAF domain-containing protein [Actinomycetales bacterium]
MIEASLEEGPLRLLLDATPNGLLALSPAGVLCYANPAARELFGIGLDDLLGPDPSALLAGLDRTAPDGTRQWARGCRQDGSFFDAEVVLIPLRDEGGAWTFCVVQDLTERLTAQLHLQSLNRLYLTLIDVQRAVVRAGSTAALFEDLCWVLVRAGGFLAAWVGEPQADGSVAVTACQGKVDDYVQQADISVLPSTPRGQGPTGTALREDRPVYTQDFFDSAATLPWQQRARLAGIRSSAALPLRRRGVCTAALTLYSSRPHAFTPEICELLERVAEDISAALDRFADRDELRLLGEQRRLLLERVVDAQELERSRIAADVHDEPVQTLTAVMLRLGLLEQQLTATAPALVPEAARLSSDVSDAIDQLRALLFDLSPVPPDTPLAAALHESASAILSPASIRWSLDVDPQAPSLAMPLRRKAVRIVREALRNVVKHAAASAVTLTMRPEHGGLAICVTDDGRGREQHLWVSAPGHRGLTTMRDRAAMVAGSCEWLPGEEGRGTTVRVWLPADDTAASLA